MCTQKNGCKNNGNTKNSKILTKKRQKYLHEYSISTLSQKIIHTVEKYAKREPLRSITVLLIDPVFSSHTVL